MKVFMRKSTKPTGTAVIRDGLTDQERGALKLAKVAMVALAGAALLTVAGPVMAQTAPAAARDVSAITAGLTGTVNGFIDIAKVIIYGLTVLVIMVLGGMSAWTGDKSYIIKAFAVAVGVTMAYFAPQIAAWLGFSG